MRNNFISVIVMVLISVTGCHSNPQVVLKTRYGDIVCEIYEDKAPVTAGNFLRYVDESRFAGASFYRVVTMTNQPDNPIKIEVVQGGLYDDVHPRHLPPIAHEPTSKTGVLHKDGVLSMARNQLGTAQADFFFCIGDQPELDFGGQRNSDGQGFAAFGKVIRGMDVILTIHSLDNSDQMIDQPVLIESIKRI